MRTGNRMAGMEGVEPPLTEPESAVLPLDDIPIDAGASQRKQVLYGMLPACASPNFQEFCGLWMDHGGKQIHSLMRTPLQLDTARRDAVHEGGRMGHEHEAHVFFRQDVEQHAPELSLGHRVQHGG